jgi:hypothetical protein
VADEQVLWAYGIVPRAQAAETGVPGVEGRPVEPVVHGELAVLVSAVPSERYTSEALQQRLEDMAALSALARAHDEVLDAALRAGDVLPFRMCTLYETPDAIRAMLAAEAGRFGAVLRRLHGRAEWGVKGFAATRAEPVTASRPGSGTEYLARARARRDQAVESREGLEAAAAEVHAALASRAAGAVLSRPQDRRLSGRDEEMILNGAYLVAHAAAEAFAERFAELRDRHDGLTLELTGPWPPYHFAAEPEG